jgi:hypothetical protein
MALKPLPPRAEKEMLHEIRRFGLEIRNARDQGNKLVQWRNALVHKGYDADAVITQVVSLTQAQSVIDQLNQWCEAIETDWKSVQGKGAAEIMDGDEATAL